MDERPEQNGLAVAAGHHSLDVIVAGLPSDAHTWNLVFIQLLLEDLGHRVRNLGSCVSAEELVGACHDGRPDLVVISSINGHGTHDARSVIAALRADRHTAALPAVIGGKLDTSGAGDAATRDLLAAGWDAVFTETTAASRFEEFLSGLAKKVLA